MKKSVLALLLVAVFTICTCRLPSVDNGDVPTTQPSTDVEQTPAAENKDVKYINVQLADGTGQQKFAVMNKDGMYLSGLYCAVGGTERIREILHLLLSDLNENQFVTDDDFKLLTNTVRGDMTGVDIVSIGRTGDNANDNIEVLSFNKFRGGTLVYDNEKSYFLPNEGIHFINIEQKVEILYLTQEQYDILCQSTLFDSITKYDDLTKTAEYKKGFYDPFIRCTTWDGAKVSVPKKLN